MSISRQQALSSFHALRRYCEERDFAGWDPYDGLNSRVFQATPLKHWPLARLAWIQAFKRNPINLRRLLLVPQGHNAKGIALFLTGYCNLLQIQRTTGTTEFGEESELLGKIHYLANLLLSLQSKGYSGACWGYNFDWQSRAFFLPNATPTVVATAFCVEGLLQAFEVTGNDRYKVTAVSAADFVLNDLNRIEKDGGFMFSYSPLDHQAVYNATLLGTKILALIYSHEPLDGLADAATKSARAVCLLQNQDGSFPHSDQVGNSWRDSFHTGFKLESLAFYSNHFGNSLFRAHVEAGFDYWIRVFFDHETGMAYYYEDRSQLVDLHCVAQAIPTIYKLGEFSRYRQLIGKIAHWAISKMQAPDGSFYFQLRQSTTNKIRYMRWPNAWMFYGMSYYFRGLSEL